MPAITPKTHRVTGRLLVDRRGSELRVPSSRALRKRFMHIALEAGRLERCHPCGVIGHTVANLHTMNTSSKAPVDPHVRPGPSKLRLNTLTWLNRGCRRFGFRVAVSRTAPGNPARAFNSPGSYPLGMPTALEGALYGLLALIPKINIVQIGANDGSSGDPVHRFIRSAWNQTNLLLCEPQPELISLLTETYRGHPSLQIFPGSVTPGGSELILYRVRPDCWPQMHAGYAIESPCHAAPSGIASVNYLHVANFVRRWSTLDPESAIEELKPEALSVPSFIKCYLQAQPVHVLQVDVEGLDVALVQEALDPGLRPNIINFEHSHADETSLTELCHRLEACQYRVFKGESDVLAVLQQSI